jgi:microcystin-dependent protein
MSDQFIGEIRIFGTNFAPVGWAFCDGQLMSISQNPALFSLLGTTYGGNGTSNFALPNFQGVSPIHFGQGPGLSPRDLGETGGTETVTLLASEMPTHTHAANCNSGMGDQYGPPGNFWATDAGGNFEYNAGATPNMTMAAGALGPTGGNRPHNNLQPYLVMNFCIALQGIFPARG